MDMKNNKKIRISLSLIIIGLSMLICVVFAIAADLRPPVTHNYLSPYSGREVLVLSRG